jgi:hypothetical protein
MPLHARAGQPTLDQRRAEALALRRPHVRTAMLAPLDLEFLFAITFRDHPGQLVVLAVIGAAGVACADPFRPL